MDEGTMCSLAWNSGNFTSQLFHNLSSHCRKDSVSDFLVYPSSFFVQLVRFSLCICAFITLLAFYNTLSVMSKQMLSVATCSLYWVFMTVAMALKCVVLMIFPILAWKTPSLHQAERIFNQSGFLLQTVLQSLATLLLFLALDHERRFRSSDCATVDKPTKHCVAMTCSRRLYLSWARLVAVCLTTLPLLILLAIEVIFAVRSEDADLSKTKPLVWAYIATLPLARLGALLLGWALLCNRGNRFTPTIPAKIYLVLGLLLSLMEDFPNFVTSCSSDMECQLGYHMSVYDLLQLVGVLALIFFVFFVRSQYLRVEQECKLNLVTDLQKLLHVNGRKNIIRHYST